MSNEELRRYMIKVPYTGCKDSQEFMSSVVHTVAEVSEEKARQRAREYTMWAESVSGIGGTELLASNEI